MPFMIVVLDTTALMADPSLRGTAWAALAHAADVWDVKIVVPEIVLTEAVGGYQRTVAEAMVGLERWATKHVARLQLTKVHEAAQEALVQESADYGQRLADSLNDLGATVIPPPDVPHTVLVERAVRRQRPCDAKGDGYRDTLNWLTLLNLASEHPEEQLVWVSDNTRDFGAGAEGCEWHPDLIVELEAAGAAARVRWVRSLGDLVLELAASYSTSRAEDLDAVQKQLRSQSLAGFLAAMVVPTMPGRRLDARRCALPTLTDSATIVEIGEMQDLTTDVRGTFDDSQAVIEFAFEAETTIELIVRLGTGPEHEATPVEVVKILRYSGPLAQDHYGRPLSAELNRIEARPDDPGRVAWASLAQANRAKLTRPNLPPGYLDSIKNLQQQMLTPAYLDSIKKFQQDMLTPAYLDSIKKFQQDMLTPAYLDSIKKFQQDMLTPAYLDSIMKFQQQMLALGYLDAGTRPQQPASAHGEPGDGSVDPNDEETSGPSETGTEGLNNEPDEGS